MKLTPIITSSARPILERKFGVTEANVENKLHKPVLEFLKFKGIALPDIAVPVEYRYNPYSKEDNRLMAAFNNRTKSMMMNVFTLDEYSGRIPKAAILQFALTHETDHAAFDQTPMGKKREEYREKLESFAFTIKLLFSADRYDRMQSEMEISSALKEGRSMYLEWALLNERFKLDIPFQSTISKGRERDMIYAKFIMRLHEMIGPKVWALTGNLLPSSLTAFSNPDAYIMEAKKAGMI